MYMKDAEQTKQKIDSQAQTIESLTSLCRSLIGELTLLRTDLQDTESRIENKLEDMQLDLNRINNRLF